MSRVRIYTKQRCPFSELAVSFLEEKGISFDEVNITGRPALKAAMVEAAGGSDTTPQIFIDGTHLGGYEELVDEDRLGRLAATVSSGPEPPGAS